VIQQEYAARMESKGAPRVITPSSSLDTKVWSLRQFLPWLGKMPTTSGAL
jgi:hypothetical protein